jgi:hypothetical protein
MRRLREQAFACLATYGESCLQERKCYRTQRITSVVVIFVHITSFLLMFNHLFLGGIKHGVNSLDDSIA